jgi:hypothetical protein
MSRIAILGWGSLLWDLETLSPHVALPWAMRAGPRLPMEFSRVSPKRRMGLVVALDAEDGVPCATHAVASRRARLEEAIVDLAARERAPVSRIGWAEACGTSECRIPAIGDAVALWCVRGGWDAAIWTDLDPNFRAMTGKPFSITAGITHLRELAPANLAEAHRYIRSAPLSTRTPLRRALARDRWWQGLRHERRKGTCAGSSGSTGSSY